MTALSSTYAYNTAGRLQTVTDGSYSVTYSYLANSPLVVQITSKQSSTVHLTTTKRYDLWNRLQSISSVPSASSVVSSSYDYNLANQRTRLTQADGSYWVYSYDTLGHVSHAYSDSLSPAHAGFQVRYGPLDGIAKFGATGYTRHVMGHHKLETKAANLPSADEIAIAVKKRFKEALDGVLRQ